MSKLFYIFSFLIILLLLIFSISKYNRVSYSQITYQQFLHDVQNNKISNVVIDHKKIIACYAKDNCVETTIPTQDTSLLNTLIQHQVKVTGEPTSSFVSIIKGWWPIILAYIGIIILILLLVIRIISTKK